MVEKRRANAGGFTFVQVGFADQPFAFELVPLELMKENPDGLDLATPSIAFTVDDLGATHDALVGRGVQVTDLGDHQGTPSFAFSDPAKSRPGAFFIDGSRIPRARSVRAPCIRGSARAGPASRRYLVALPGRRRVLDLGVQKGMALAHHGMPGHPSP